MLYTENQLLCSSDKSQYCSTVRLLTLTICCFVPEKWMTVTIIFDSICSLQINFLIPNQAINYNYKKKAYQLTSMLLRS